jgi:NAD(P)-dependent dehydrogenase (short-subunit alcohol dehydrogenase family)
MLLRTYTNASGSSVVSISGTFGKEETGVISDFLAKKGLELFAEQLALELKDKNIRSNCVRLGFVFTENVQKFFPGVKTSETLDPKDVARQIVTTVEDTRLNGQIVELTA